MAEPKLSEVKGGVDEDLKKISAVSSAIKNYSFHNAREILQEILNRRPGWFLALRELTNLYLATENYNEAIKIIERLLKENANDEWALIHLAKIHAIRGNLIGEIDTLKKITQLKFNEIFLRRLFELQKKHGDMQGALDVVTQLRAHRNTPELEIAEAKLSNILGNKDAAIAFCKKTFKKGVVPASVIELWTSIQLNDTNNPQAILDSFLPLIKSKSNQNNGAMYVSISRALHRMDKTTEAMQYLEKAVNFPGVQAFWWYDLSLMQRQLGFIHESQKSLEKVFEIEPLNAVALRVHGVEHKFTIEDEAFKRLHYAHAFIHELSDQHRVELHFGLAKAYEDINELNTAFKHYKNAGDLQAKLTPYNHSGAVAMMKITRDRVSQMTYEKFTLPRSDSTKPVFVLGMPRSGTSLTEQVLSSHPQVFGAGELKLLHRVVDGIAINKRTIETKNEIGNVVTYIHDVDVSDCKKLDFKERGDLYVKAIESIAKEAGHNDAKRIVDKMPGNYYWTGLIPFILPNAKIIHTQRHPLDNCLSLYRIFFPDGMPWSYNLTTLGKVYRAYYEHMKHWETALPPNFMLTVNYEVMVHDFENHARKIINHLDLEWNDGCLRFYETERSVKTASLNQVRQPIYTSSVGRWKKYEEYLQPLIKELGPLVKEYDDMIEAKIAAIKTK